MIGKKQYFHFQKRFQDTNSRLRHDTMILRKKALDNNIDKFHKIWVLFSLFSNKKFTSNIWWIFSHFSKLCEVIKREFLTSGYSLGYIYSSGVRELLLVLFLISSNDNHHILFNLTMGWLFIHKFVSQLSKLSCHGVKLMTFHNKKSIPNPEWKLKTCWYFISSDSFKRTSQFQELVKMHSWLSSLPEIEDNSSWKQASNRNIAEIDN